MMMKYILRVEPSLMFKTNRSRGHDVKEVILQLAGEDEGKETKLKEESPPEEFYTVLKNSSL